LKKKIKKQKISEKNGKKIEKIGGKNWGKNLKSVHMFAYGTEKCPF
jgi:hypothetical protein